MTITHLETVEGLCATIIDVNCTDASLGTRVEVEEPNGRVGVADSDREVGDRCPVSGIPEARVEPVD
jgi:hypothetical protein